MFVNQYASLSKRDQKSNLIFSITILLYVTLRSPSRRTLSNMMQFFVKLIWQKAPPLLFKRALNKSLLMVTNKLTQPAFTYSKLKKETLEQGVKYVQS